MQSKERRRLCPACQDGHLRFAGKQDREDGTVESIYECLNPACQARWAITEAGGPQGKRAAVRSIRRLP